MVKGEAWCISVDVLSNEALLQIPVFKQLLTTEPLVDASLDYVVHLDNFAQLDGKIILVGDILRDCHGWPNRDRGCGHLRN